jgi:hypothetical protein
MLKPPTLPQRRRSNIQAATRRRTTPTSTAGSNLGLSISTAISNGATEYGTVGWGCEWADAGGRLGTRGDLEHGLNAAIPCGMPEVMSHSVVPQLTATKEQRLAIQDPLDRSGGFFALSTVVNTRRRLSWPKREPTNVPIRVVSARCRRAASIAAIIAKGRLTARPLLAIVGTPNVLPGKQ